MNIIIAGGRDFNDYELLKKEVDDFIKTYKNPHEMVTIFSGGAKGADSLGEKYAKDNNCPLYLFPVKWRDSENIVEMLRNIEMAKLADAVIVFWDKKSKGSAHMIAQSSKHNLRLKIVYYDNNK